MIKWRDFLSLRWLHSQPKYEPKKHNSTSVLLPGIIINQNKLQPFSNCVDIILNSNDDGYSETNTLPSFLRFYSDVYSIISKKYNWPYNTEYKLIDNYFNELHKIETKHDEFTQLHGISQQYLRYLFIQNEMDKIYIQSKNKDNIQKWSEIEEFLRDTKKVYDLGTDLITSMEVNI